MRIIYLILFRTYIILPMLLEMMDLVVIAKKYDSTTPPEP